MADVEDIRIDELPPGESPSRYHEVGATQGGVTTKLSIDQILGLIDAGDVQTGIAAATSDNTLEDTSELLFLDGPDLKRGALTGVVSSIFKTARKIADASFLSSLKFWDAAAPTKGLQFDLSRITAGQTRVVTWPDKDLSNIDRPLLHVREQLGSGTAGGGASAGVNVRKLNTTVQNNIAGSSGPASDQITLPAGSYEAFATAPAFGVRFNKIWLRTAGGVVLIVGQNAYADNVQADGSNATLSGRFTLASTTAVEIAHYCDTAKTTNGLGLAVTSGQPEVYTELLVRKVD